MALQSYSQPLRRWPPDSGQDLNGRGHNRADIALPADHKNTSPNDSDDGDDVGENRPFNEELEIMAGPSFEEEMEKSLALAGRQLPAQE